MQRLADVVPGRRNKGIGDAATDNQRDRRCRPARPEPSAWSTLWSRRQSRPSAAPDRRALCPALKFGRQQRPGAGDRRMFGDAVGARLGAMRRAERVHNEHIAKRRHFARQGLVAGFLAREKAHILQQHDTAGRNLDAIDPVFDQRHIAAEQLLQGGRPPAAARTCRSGCPSVGRPRCDISMTAAPASSAALIVGNAARMRASLVTLPSATGTFRSSRMRTRLPARSRSAILMTCIAPDQTALTGVIKRSPYPACGSRSPTRCRTTRHDFDQRALHDFGQPCVVSGRCRDRD